MNQEKIGKFIAERREHKKLKQKDLADKLGVTNKAISKWENGRGMPDYSLFKDLCNILDITVSELLNGELDNKSKTNKEEAITDYISYKETKHKKKNIILLVMSIIAIIVSILSIYFINSYKKISIYELSGESENFKYENGLLVKSNIKTILELGTLTSQTIKEEQIVGKTLSVKIDNEYYFISNIEKGEVISENYGYGEYLSDTKLKYIPEELYILIWYKVEDDIKTEILKVTSERHLINDKIIYKKHQSIDNRELGNPIDLNKYDSYSSYKKHLIEQGFKEPEKYHTMCDQNEIYEKEISNNEYIAIQLTNKRFCYTKKEDNIRYDVAYIQTINDRGMLSIMNIRKKNNSELSSFIYDFNTNSIAGKTTQKDLDTTNRIVDLYNKYVSNIN